MFDLLLKPRLFFLLKTKLDDLHEDRKGRAMVPMGYGNQHVIVMTGIIALFLQP